MQVRRIQIKNFRCFSDFQLDLDAPLIMLVGVNGSGKTSILEALHYACYLRSFRTHTPLELLTFDADNFFIKVDISDEQDGQSFEHELHVGFSQRKRLVKIDQKAISSYKELTSYYRVVTLTEDDLGLIKGSPDGRRAFIDQSIILHEPQFLMALRRYKQIVNNRNALLSKRAVEKDSYTIWSQQLWQQAFIIQEKRLGFLKVLELAVNKLFHEYFDQEHSIELNYRPKKLLYNDYQEFLQHHPQLYQQEQIFGRSLFGTHLDDLCIEFKGKRSKKFASRGQQKLILVLLKVALLEQIKLSMGSALFLLDDFMTDFDQGVALVLLKILTKLSVQLIFTCPTKGGVFEDLLSKNGCRFYTLSNSA